MTSKKQIPGNARVSTHKKLKQAIVKLLEHNLENMQQDIDSLSPKDRLNFLLHLSQLVIPKQSYTAEEEEDTTPTGLRNWVIVSVPPPNYEDK